jgi:glutamate formiminotransferase/formiminotetrahydrofolate cyclodeaminase
MRQIVECVPNFSEGRREDVVTAIAKAIGKTGDVKLLGVQMDADHNRSVITFVGTPDAVADAAFAGVARAAELINLEQHSGEHPRMGAADVVPFVPIAGVTMDDCVELAHRVGQRIGEELGIPVYLYERAATRPERHNLADVRRGEYERIRDTIQTDPDRAPDYGPAQVGPAGATAVGARPPLIAYNVNLGTNNLDIANAIARVVRHSSGGLRYVKALGFDIEGRGMVQVSMNMTNYTKTPLFRVFEMIKREAERYGVPVVSSEVVGLTPADALYDAADFYLQLEDFRRGEQVLENRLVDERSTTPDDFLNELAAGTATPGGGTAAAVAGAMGAALVHMVTALSVGREQYADVEDELQQVGEKAAALKSRFARLAQQDGAAFDAVMQAYRMPKDTDAQRAERSAAIQDALRAAIEVPLDTARAGVETLREARIAARHGNANAVTDAATGAHLAATAVHGAALNVRVNAGSLRDEDEATHYGDTISELESQATALLQEVVAATRERS